MATFICLFGAYLLLNLLIVPSPFLVLVHGRVIREVPDPHDDQLPNGFHTHSDGSLENGYLTVPHSDHWNIESLLPKEYNRLMPPILDGKPVKVRIALNVTQLLSIKEDEQSFSVHAHMSQEWYDHRIKFPQNFSGPTIGLDSTWRERIWTPDTYFHNAIDGKGIAILIPYFNFLLHKDSRVEMVIRTVLTVTCHMNLRMFPHDTQICNIVIVSLFCHKQVQFEWKSFTLGSLDSIDFPKFSVDSIHSGNCSFPRQNGHDCVKASVHLRRRWEYYFIRIYGPSFLLVVTTFIGFYLPVFAYPARVAIIVTPLLSLITQQTQINAEINVNYVVSLHVWMMACTFFVFMALIELGFAVVYIHRVEERKSRGLTGCTGNTSSSSSASINTSCSSVECGFKLRPPPPPKKLRLKVRDKPLTKEKEKASPPSPNVPYDREKRRFSYDFIVKPEVGSWLKNFLESVYGQIDWYKAPSDRNKVDYVSRLLFPTMFAMFILIYVLVVYHSIE